MKPLTKGLMIAALLAATIAGAVGCHDATFRERQARRDQRVAHLLDSIPKMDRYRRACLTRVLHDAEVIRAQRAAHLDQTIRWTEEVEQGRSDRCRREPFYHDPWFRNISTGHPDLIHQTWANMVY